MWDNIGGYFYEPGYCVRDAFRRAWGDGHPIVRDIPFRCSVPYLDYICERYGLPMQHSQEGGGQLDARIGQRVIWLISEEGSPEGHAVFCTDPRRIARAQERGEILVGGYILVDG